MRKGLFHLEQGSLKLRGKDVHPTDNEHIIAAPGNAAKGQHIDYGDGGLFDTGVVSGNTCTGPAHQYKVTGSYVVMVFVTDSGGAQTVGMAGVHYKNYAPTTPAPPWSARPRNIPRASPVIPNVTRR